MTKRNLDSSNNSQSQPVARQGEQVEPCQGTPAPETTHSNVANQNSLSPASVEEQDELEDGMLLRDVPKRTTFYDPVAERQMSQTDAKLFYQRSQIDIRGGIGGVRAQSSPNDSPTIGSASRLLTEYGADSLTLDHDGGIFTN